MRLLKFEAPWCGPCQFVERELSKLSLEIEIVRVDVDTGSAKLYNVRSIPTLILVDDTGKELKRLHGKVNAAEIKKMLR